MTTPSAENEADNRCFRPFLYQSGNWLEMYLLLQLMLLLYFFLIETRVSVTSHVEEA